MTVVLLSGGGAAADTDLSTAPSHLPYEARPAARMPAANVYSRYMGDSLALLDVDGDGDDELVYSSTGGYVAARARNDSADVIFYQKNIPPEFTSKTGAHAPVALLACADLDGDGKEQLIAWGHDADRFKWRFWNLDPATGATITTFDLPGERDRRPDGVWDGNYYVAGTVDVATGDATTRALVIGCTVGHDAYGRGLRAVDPRDGRLLWRFDTGPNPFPHTTRLSDLDGDGRPEIVFTGRSPDNLQGERINGYSDDQTVLFVLDAQGQLRWSRPLCGWYGNAELDLADMDGDGRLDIVTSAHTTPEVWSELAVWTVDGECLTRLAADFQMETVMAVQREDRELPSLVVGSVDRQLREFDFVAGALVPRRSVRFSSHCRPNLIEDFLPPAGAETVVSCADGSSYVLDQELAPLAALPEAGDWWSTSARIWQTGQDQPLLIWPSEAGQAAILHEAAFAWQRLLPRPLAAGLLLAGSAVLLLLRRRPRRAPDRPEHEPGLLRETRLNLLDNLELSSHGAVAPLQGVRRLVWHLRALQADLGANPKVEVRMRETWTECHDSALPNLKGIVDRALLAGLAPELVAVVAAATAEIEAQLERLALENFRDVERQEIAEALDAAEAQAAMALGKLRREVATHFQADVAQVVANVHTARRLDLEKAGVAWRAGRVAAAAGGGAETDPPAATVIGLCDPRELEFVLDNLVGNAIAAMAESSPRRLDLRWRTNDGMVLIDVSDTGCGLPAADWDRALNSRYTTREGGGNGLPMSRKYLRRYGGNLSIAGSTPGRGTTFRVVVPVN